MRAAAGTMRRTGPARPADTAGVRARDAGAAAAALAAAAAGTGVAALAWRAAEAVDWRLWEASDAVVAAAGVAGAVLALRFCVEVVAASVAMARGATAPAWTGRLARAVAAGLAATLLGAGVAHADDPPPSAGWLPAAAGAVVAPAPAPAPWTPATRTPSPARIVPAEAPAEVPATGSAQQEDPVHVVTPGESLWSITADALGDGASTADVAAAWPRLYAANRDEIGPDPDLIHPGLRLALPGPLTRGAR
ncbi:LysM peptidoglycan-binding domain-containing protein [Demequina maris]|uniref:LysM peptidoglycan-binding domain-containing protein n=1 Tax=Demequina maris TaxID=1638982 RepID=UPI000A655AFC|nr:LysM domain-containing protein [Demequina maris]